MARRPRLRRRYHLHLPGVLFVGVMVLVLIGALNSENNLLYWMFGVAIGVVIISGLLSGSSLMGLRVDAWPPASVTAGSQALVRFRLRNTNRWMPAVALSLDEVSTGRRRALRLSGIGSVASIPAGSSVDVTVPIQTLGRGRYKLRGLRASTTFPFGLTRKSVLALDARELVVRPRPAPVQSSVLLGAFDGREPIRRTNTRLGARGEPYGVREYVAGDPMRSVAWRASARSDELRVVEESLPHVSTFRIAFRLPADAPDEWADAAVELAAGVGAAAARAGATVEIVGIQSDGKGLDEMLDLLADLDPRTLAAGDGAEMEHAGPRGGKPAVVITDTSFKGRQDLVLDVAEWASRRSAELADGAALP